MKKRRRKKDENGNIIEYPKIKLIDLFEEPVEYNTSTNKKKRGNDKHVNRIVDIAMKYEKERQRL